MRNGAQRGRLLRALPPACLDAPLLLPLLLILLLTARLPQGTSAVEARRAGRRCGTAPPGGSRRMESCQQRHAVLLFLHRPFVDSGSQGLSRCVKQWVSDPMGSTRQLLYRLSCETVGF